MKPNKPAMPELVSAEELARKVFDASSRPRPSTLKKWGRQGLLPSVRLGKRRFFPLGESVAAIAALVGGSTPHQGPQIPRA